MQQRVVRWALVGTFVCLALAFADVNRTGTNPLNFVQPGQDGPSVAVIEADFPDTELPDGLGLDGQQFYVMARDPLHPSAGADALDRPQYRWQRPLYAWLAWVLHPTGGGVGLVWAMVAVGAAATFLGSVATGRLAVALGGPPWAAVLFGLLPGAYYCLRVSVADALALALAVAALALDRSGRRRSALVAGAAAVLAKESIGLVLLGWWLAAPRDRGRLRLVVVPAAVGVAWFVVVHLVVPAGHGSVEELAPPLVGWWEALTDRWLHGDELLGMAASVAALVAAVAALARYRLGHALSAVVATQLAFTFVVNGNVLGQDFGGTRSTMALLLLAVLALVTPSAARPRSGPGPAPATSLPT